MEIKRFSSSCISSRVCDKQRESDGMLSYHEEVDACHVCGNDLSCTCREGEVASYPEHEQAFVFSKNLPSVRRVRECSPNIRALQVLIPPYMDMGKAVSLNSTCLCVYKPVHPSRRLMKV